MRSSAASILALVPIWCCPKVVFAQTKHTNNATSSGYAQVFETAASCSANAQCNGLAGDCCPTSLSGIFLDCCPKEPTEASCSAHPSCSGLTGDCCPAADGKDLYCCYQAFPSPNYKPEFTLFGHPDPSQNQASYWLSTGDHTEGDEGDRRLYAYQRFGNNLFDLLYLQTDRITDAAPYVSGAKRFYMTIDESNAPPCTQILLQLDSIPSAREDNYPTGRHSRYLATYTPASSRLEFTFLDRPDPTIPDNAINAIAILFEPGIFVAGQYVYSFLDSAVSCGTSSDPACQPSPVNMCQAIHVDEVCTNDESSCDNPSCATEPFCMENMATSFLALEDKSVIVVTSSSGVLQRTSFFVWFATSSFVIILWGIMS